MRLLHGDCITQMRSLPESSVDAIITDPPYGLEFMGKKWDSFKTTGGQTRTWCDKESSGVGIGAPRFSTQTPAELLAFEEWTTTWATEALRVLKPGGHLLAFGGTRTHHRLMAGIEDAGFEIRDCLMWLYGSGFPKSKNVSLAIDKGEGHPNRGKAIPTASSYQASDTQQANRLTSHKVDPYDAKTDAARKWEGWGTALKPAWEPVVVARKPLIGTVAQNVLEHGTGALNIDGCRIGTERPPTSPHSFTALRRMEGRSDLQEPTADTEIDKGRWPANITLDEDAAAQLDAQAGTRGAAAPASGPTYSGKSKSGSMAGHFNGMGDRPPAFHGDTGGPSRFFYCAKASKKERNAGCAELAAKQQDTGRKKGNPGGDNPRNRGASDRQNHHPTVKPVALMRWLVRLITPPGGTVLDPFAGSGTTGVACAEEGVECILIEREKDYLPIIKARVKHAEEQVKQLSLGEAA